MKIVLDKGAFLPERAHTLDAGYDLRAPDGGLVPAGKYLTIDTGVHMAITPGMVGFIKSKSGLNVNRNITTTGVIDAGYTGSIKVKLYNHGNSAYCFTRGDKIAQLVILPIFTPDLEVVDELPETDRGANGFGSTGR